MANKIILKRSSVAGKVPLSTDLDVGELSVNLADALLYTKDGTGTVIALGGSGGTGLPTQSGNAGKFLTTNGATPSWATIDSSYITTALGFTPANQATVTGDWNTKTNGQLSLISGNTNSYNGTTALSGVYLPHATGAYGTNVAGRLDNLYFRTEENGTWASWRKVLHEGNFSTYAVPWTGGTLTGGLTVNSGSTTGRNQVQSQNDAGNYAQLEVRGSAETGTLFGKTLANWGYVRAAGGTLAGLMLGTTTVAPVLFGTSNIEAGQITASGQRWLIGGATDDGTTRLQVNGNVSATAFIGSAASLTGLTSTQVTTALGFTPYNATNPSGYTANTGTVTSIGMTVPTGLSVTGSPVTTSGTLAVTLAAGYSIPTTASQTNWDTAYTDRNKWDGGSTGLVAATARTSLGLVIGTNVQAWDSDLDAIGALAGTSGFLKKTAANTWTLDTSTYLTANQSISVTGDATGSGTTAIALTLAASGVTAGTYSSLTVDAKGRVTGGTNPGYLTSITSGNVTTALGFTPYNATNPSGYISSISSNMVTTALGFTPYNATNPNGYVTASGSVNYAGTAGTATYVSSPDGDRLSSSKYPNANGQRVRFDFVGAGQANGAGNYGGVMTYSPYDGTSASTGDSSYQLAFGNDSGTNASGMPRLSLRNGINTTWNSWYILLHAGNYTSYSPSLTGSGASGTWGINITGSAGSAGSATNATNVSGGNVQGSYIGVQQTGGGGAGISLYNGSTSGQPTYGIMFATTANYGTHGSVTADWATYFTMDSTANRGWVFRNTTSGNVASVNNSGTAVFNGNVTAYSDERLKTNWRDLPADFIERLALIKHGIYDRTDDTSLPTQVGVSAQSLRVLLPNAVDAGTGGILSVAYGNAAMVSAVKLAERVVEQDARIARLEALISKLIEG